MNVNHSIVINRPLEYVFGFMANFDNDVLWWKEVQESKRLSTGDLGVGATFWQSSRMFGLGSETVFEIIGFEPNKTVRIQTLSGPLYYTAAYHFANLAGSTELTFSAHIQPGGLIRLFGPLVGIVLGRMSKTNFANLKLLLETP